jgi:MarR family transcriptional regulator, organic hydroperoxide resistance regulator
MQAATTAPDERTRTSSGFELAFREFMQAVRRARARAAREPGMGDVPFAQFQLLEAVDAAGEIGSNRVAEAAGVAPPTATRALDVLERKGLVERRPMTADRRGVAVLLTTDGRRLLERRRRFVRRKLRALYESLDERERGQAEELLRRLAVLIEDL